MAQLPASTRLRLERQRQAAPVELPKTRLCGAVVGSFLSGKIDLDGSVVALKAGLGSDWHILRAFQFMSGRQALFAAECAEGVERENLVLAHKVAKSVSEADLLTKHDLAHIRAACVTAAASYRSA